MALRWQPTEDFAVPLPAADVLLNDDGFEGPVDRKGHGLQRALILTLLQHMAKATSADVARQELGGIVAQISQTEIGIDAESGGETETDTPQNQLSPGSETQVAAGYTLPGLILAIEEPELYQHPTKQRHFAKVLSQLSSGELAGVAHQTQVLFATHSSLFVSMDRFEEVRLSRRRTAAGSEHKECYLTYSTLAHVARRLEEAYGKAEGTYTAEGLRPRLHVINAEIAEGLFADAVVLVEGVSDRAAIIAAAYLEDIDLEALGIAILWVDGKTKMDRSAAIFTSFGIPTFAIWDCDKRSDGVHGVEQNRAMQFLMGCPPEEIVDATDKISKTFACFETKLENKLKEELGSDIYQEKIAEIKVKYGIEGNKDAEKAPFAMRELLTASAEQGKKSSTLRDIVTAIAALRGASTMDTSATEKEATSQ